MEILIVDDEPLARRELKFLLQENTFVNQIYEAESIEEADERVKEIEPDVVFLDIKLDDGNGMVLAKKWKVMGIDPYVVFATAYDQYALDAFNAQAIDYILKPFDPVRINETINRLQKLSTRSSYAKDKEINDCQNPRLSITNEDKTMIIKKSKIIFLEAKNGIVEIITDDLVKNSTRQSLANLQSQLDTNQFLRVHRSYVVNLDDVLELQPSFNHTYELTLKGGFKIPVSRSHVTETKLKLGMEKG